MANKILNPDIAYQPKTPSFSFSRIPEERKKIKFRMNIFFTLFLGIPSFFVLVFLFLSLLNFFNIISLNSLSPVFKDLPKYKVSENINAPHKISDTNQFVLSGSLQKYDDKTITVRYSGKTIVAEYNLDTRFYKIRSEVDKTNSSLSEEIGILKLYTSVLKPENIGKNVTIQYKKEGNRIILETVSFY